MQDVPVAMTALSSELRDSTIRDLADIEGYSPNVVFNDGAENGNGRGTRVIIRGVAGSAFRADRWTPATKRPPVSDNEAKSCRNRNRHA